MGNAQDLVEQWKRNAERLCVPIPGAASAGIESSYDPDFWRTKGEIDKLAALSGGVPNWGDVVALSHALLEQKTKDWRLLGWAAIGRLNTEGLSGLGDGLAAMLLVTQKYAPEMFPEIKRLRGRGNLVTWLNDYVASYLTNTRTEAVEDTLLAALEQLYAELDAFWSDHLASFYGGLGSLRAALRMKAVIDSSASAAPPQPETQAAAPAATPPAVNAPSPRVEVPAARNETAVPKVQAPSAGASAPSSADISDVLRFLRDVSQQIAQCAGQLRAVDNAESWPYRLQRTAIWLPVRVLPPTEEGKTRIPPPPREHKTRLDAFEANGQWSELLDLAEGLTQTYVLWLDLHRSTALALERLGDRHIEAKKAVVSEVLAFVERLPELQRLTFSDGTPFADGKTQIWLEQESSRIRGSGGASKAVDAEKQEYAQALERAETLLDKGELDEGLALASRLASAGTGGRSRFRAWLSLALKTDSAGKFEIASAILDGLLDEAFHQNLDIWEPELASQLYSSLLRIRSRQTEPGAPPKVASIDLYNRLCRLDPASALRLKRP